MKYYKRPNRAKIVEKKEADNIKKYSDYKILFKLGKERSPNLIKFIEDKDDDWFIHVITYRKKTGIITNTSLIIKSDVETWKEHLINAGYNIEN
jgi:hypothetical protein